MSCENVQERISLILGRRVPGEDREIVLAHIDSCRECSAYYDSMQKIRTALRTLPQPELPGALTSRLRVLASHERERRANSTWAARVRAYLSRAELLFDNMMRPVALPFGGGLLSTMLLFSILLPNLTFQHAFADQGFFTFPDGEVIAQSSNGTYAGSPFWGAPTIERLDTPTPDDANVVVLTVDQYGKVANFSVDHGQLTPDLQSIILFSTFKPATVLGVPTWGKVKAVQQLNPRPRNMRS